jgi:hypothetical protein
MDWEGATSLEFAICQARILAYEGAQNLKARENNHAITDYKLYQLPHSAKIVSENFHE